MVELTTEEKARLARNAYQRKWRAEHREKVKEIQMRYWERKAAEEERKVKDAKD